MSETGSGSAGKSSLLGQPCSVYFLAATVSVSVETKLFFDFGKSLNHRKLLRLYCIPSAHIGNTHSRTAHIVEMHSRDQMTPEYVILLFYKLINKFAGVRIFRQWSKLRHNFEKVKACIALRSW